MASGTLLLLLTENQEGVLDSLRSLLDTFPLDQTIHAIDLLNWESVPPSAHAARIERCRLVSYSAIMHGSSLLPHLPSIARLLVQLMGDTNPLVAEELLRTVGNLARYVFATHSSAPPLPPDALLSLVAPLIGGADGESAANATARGRACLLAAHRVLLELPPDLALRSEAVLPTARVLLQVLGGRRGAEMVQMPASQLPAGCEPPAEALAPLARLAQLVGAHLPSQDVHLICQCALKCLHSYHSPNARRGAIELLRVLAPLLKAREANQEAFAAPLIAWIADEVALLPEGERVQLAVQDLVAAYGSSSDHP